jgi:hypothetical protein
MQPISYARHQFPAEIIQHATWLYLRFTLSYRDVEELLAERGIKNFRRNRPALGPEIRPCLCPQPAPATAKTDRHLAPG